MLSSYMQSHNSPLRAVKNISSEQLSLSQKKALLISISKTKIKAMWILTIKCCSFLEVHVFFLMPGDFHVLIQTATISYWTQMREKVCGRGDGLYKPLFTATIQQPAINSEQYLMKVTDIWVILVAFRALLSYLCDSESDTLHISSRE